MSNAARKGPSRIGTRRAGAPVLPPVDSAAPSRTFSLPPDLLASLLADGDDELVAWTLRTAIAERGRATAYDELVSSAMALVGERWVEGRWGIAEEHLASQTIIRALERVRPETPAAAARTAPLAILAGVSGEHHMIGLICLGHLLEEGGWAVANLGADVPGVDIARFAARQGARLVAITASLDERLPTVRDALDALRTSEARGAAVILGGRLAAAPGRAAELGVDWAGASLADAVPVLARLRASVGAGR